MENQKRIISSLKDMNGYISIQLKQRIEKKETIFTNLTLQLKILEQKLQELRIKSQPIGKKYNHKKYWTQAVINALPMIEIDPLTNMFKSNPNVIKR